jgi:hypothetical protein
MLGLSLGQSLELRLALECTVCRQYLDSDKIADDVTEVALYGKLAYAQCPSCRRIVADRHDRNYRARVRRFLERRKTQL